MRQGRDLWQGFPGEGRGASRAPFSCPSPPRASPCAQQARAMAAGGTHWGRCRRAHGVPRGNAFPPPWGNALGDGWGNAYPPHGGNALGVWRGNAYPPPVGNMLGGRGGNMFPPPGGYMMGGIVGYMYPPPAPCARRREGAARPGQSASLSPACPFLRRRGRGIRGLLRPWFAYICTFVAHGWDFILTFVVLFIR